MKKLLVIIATLALVNCAKKEPEIVTDVSKVEVIEKFIPITKEESKKAEKAAEEFIKSEYQEAVGDALKSKIAVKTEISDLLAKIEAKSSKEQKVATLQPEAPIIEPVVELKPIKKPKLSLSDKLYNATIKPVKRQVLKWNMYINKEVPKYMKGLKNEPSAWVIIATLFAAFVYGILHTLGPGHGKMVIATYFLTQQATIWQGIWLGLQTAFAHVGGAIILVITTDVALRSIVLDPAKHMYLLKNISFGLIIFVGCFMLLQGILHTLGLIKKPGCSHCHSHSKPTKKPTKRETIVALSIGCIPCTGSLLILLYAMANDILMLGLLMVVFVAIGMALTMIIIGLISLYGKKKFLDKYVAEDKNSHKYATALELLGAIFIICIGSLLLSVNI